MGKIILREVIQTQKDKRHVIILFVVPTSKFSDVSITWTKCGNQEIIKGPWGREEQQREDQQGTSDQMGERIVSETLIKEGEERKYKEKREGLNK